jgi:FlaA1/EpsC-like NDP-sugar epimerase
MLSNLLWTIPLQAMVFHSFGLYRGIWRFASIPDLRRIVLAAGTVGLAIPTVLLMLQRLNDVPRTVLVLHPLLLVLFMGGSRFLYRAWKDGQLISPRQFDAEPVLVMGAGAAGSALLRDMASSRVGAPWACSMTIRPSCACSFKGFPCSGGSTTWHVLPRHIRCHRDRRHAIRIAVGPPPCG